MTGQLSQLLAQVERLHRATPALWDFGPWPSDIAPTDRGAVPGPGAALIQALPKADPLIAAFQAAADLLEWRQTYTADEVGAHFLQAYGYVELFGPRGHFHSNQLRGYLAYWGPHLDYGWHDHEAEELYFGLMGRPEFLSKSKPSVTLSPGETRHHAPWEQHAMRTHDTPFLCYAVWRGPGLAGTPAMTTQAQAS